MKHRIWVLGMAWVGGWIMNAAAAETVTYSYDAAGRLTNAGYSGGANLSYAYDANGNLLERIVTDDGGMETVATPVFDPDGGAQAGSSVLVAVSCATAEATIRYTTDGDDPTEADAEVISGGAVSVPVPGTLKARAWKGGMTPSGVRSADYTAAGSPAWDDGHQDLGGGWRRLAWFGDYAVMALEGWIWHNRHGFFFVSASSTSGDVWLYANDMGWLYTGNTLYPFLYRASDGAWLWYNGSVNPRWFINFTSGQWEWWP